MTIDLKAIRAAAEKDQKQDTVFVLRPSLVITLLDRLEAAEKAPAEPAVEPVSDDLRDRLAAISAAIADQDDRAAQAMIREILSSPPPPAEPAPSKARLMELADEYADERRLGFSQDDVQAKRKALEDALK